MGSDVGGTWPVGGNAGRVGEVRDESTHIVLPGKKCDHLFIHSIRA